MFYKFLGHVLYTVSWPLHWIHLSRGERVYVVIEQDRKVLVVRNWFDVGRWSFPGGGKKRQENQKQAAVREVMEETGIDLKDSDLTSLGNFSRGLIIGRKHYTLFKAKISSPRFLTNPLEITGAKWVSTAQLSKLWLSPEISKAIVPDDATGRSLL